MNGPELRYPVSALCSYHYFKNPDLIRRWHAGGLRLIGDSGAFSAFSLGKPIDLDAFASWGRQVRPYVTWVASLDAIGNADKSWANWRALRTLGVDAVPTVHYGATPSAMDRYVDEGVDFIGLGGMVGRKGEPERLLRWALSMMRHARDAYPQLRFHGWGVTHPRLMNLPWYSVDSSGFGSGYRYARLTLFNPASRTFDTCELRHAHRHAALLRQHYSTDPALLLKSGPQNIDLHSAVATRSAQLMEDYLRRRHNVTAPTYGLREPAPGTSVHIANSNGSIITRMCKATARDGAA